MKEIIEYILAALIIISVIPVITYVENTVYAPRPRGVEPIVQVLFANKIFNTINQIFETGNLTLFQPSIFNTIIAQELSSYSDYGYNITIKPYAIKIDEVGWTINVTSMYNGTISLLVVSTGLAIRTVNTPRNIILLQNNTYKYVFANPFSPIYTLMVVAVLDIGTAKFIDYKIVSNNVNKLSLVNINGKVYLLAPTTLNTPLTTSPGQAIICYYDPATKNYYYYGSINYNYISSISYYRAPNYFWGTLYNTTTKYTEYSRIKYDVIYAGTLALYGNTYNMFGLYSYTNQTTGYFDGRYYFTGSVVTNTVSTYTTTVINTVTYQIGWWITYTSTTTLPVEANVTVTYPKITSTTLTSSSTTSYITSSATATYPIYYPLLNVVAILVVDSSGNVYVALPYFAYLAAGSTIPRNWPVSHEAYWFRVGMFTYYVQITIWRKSI